MKLRQAVLFGAALLSSGVAMAQNPFSFTKGKATDEGAILLYWQSETNTIYEIQYADGLIDTNTGYTTWAPLHTEYCSHGTNTFIGDYGNYNETPAIPHPRKSLTRFYRIKNIGTNTAAANPTVAIVSPTNGAILSGYVTISISASTSDIITDQKLYVDGQEMKPAIDGTNFVINTCEWANGSHVLFATAKSQSAFEGVPNVSPVTYGRAASPYVTVTFDNLIQKFAWSEWFFKPSLNQTQQVSASFAANVNWTLYIQDTVTNTVRTVTGSGTSMQYNWDGTGDGGAALPAGTYTYLLTAYTNGGAFSMLSESESLSSLSTSSDSNWYPTSAQEARAAGWSSYFVQFPPMPPYLSNGVWYVPEPPDLVEIPLRDTSLSESSLLSSGGSYSMDLLDANTPSSQSNRGPDRPPITPIRDPLGTFGVGFQTYPGGISTPAIPSGKLFPVGDRFVKLDGNHTTETWGDLSDAAVVANAFKAEMLKDGYDPLIILTQRRFAPGHLLTNLFNTVNIATIMLHTSYGTTTESTSDILHIYQRFYDYYGTKAITNVKLDDCSFGGAGTNGLKWLALCECNAMHDENWTSMQSYDRLPINNNLHLLVGARSFMTAAPNLTSLWASNMIHGVTVRNAWMAAGHAAYTAETNHILISFSVAGWPSSFADLITDINKDPDTSGGQASIDKQDETVYFLP